MPNVEKIVMEDGTSRFVHGRLHYPDPPPVGTVIGPNELGEHLVVVGQDGADTLVAYATKPDLQAAIACRTAGGDPRSLAEMRILT